MFHVQYNLIGEEEWQTFGGRYMRAMEALDHYFQHLINHPGVNWRIRYVPLAH